MCHSTSRTCRDRHEVARGPCRRPADAGDPGRPAADGRRARLRAEVRRHPGAGRRRRRPRGAAASASGRGSATRRPRSSRRSCARSKRSARRSTAPLLLDGEIVALDDARAARRLPAAAGPHPPHRRARTSSGSSEAQPVALIAFDLLRDGDDDLRGLPLTERRARLEARIATAHVSTRSASASRSPATAARCTPGRSRKAGRADRQGSARAVPVRPAQPGVAQAEGPAEQEFVVGGWTEPRQTRQYFGALLLGVPRRERPGGARPTSATPAPASTRRSSRASGSC